MYDALNQYEPNKAYRVWSFITAGVCERWTFIKSSHANTFPFALYDSVHAFNLLFSSALVSSGTSSRIYTNYFHIGRGKQYPQLSTSGMYSPHFWGNAKVGGNPPTGEKVGGKSSTPQEIFQIVCSLRS